MAWPTTDNPRTEFVTLRMTADEAADLDWLMGVSGSASRSETLRQALSFAVASERRAQARKARKTAQKAGQT